METAEREREMYTSWRLIRPHKTQIDMEQRETTMRLGTVLDDKHRP